MILVFASRDAASWAAAQAFAEKQRARLVNKLGPIDDLMLVARYGIVEPVVVLVLHGQQISARFTSLPSAGELQRALA